VSPELDRAVREGLEAMDAALGGKVPPEHDPIAGATRGACAMRDTLVVLRRQGRDVASMLGDANMLVSELVAGEFPIAGFRRKRIEKARAVYAGLAERMRTMQE
jgi:hypothetical protein